MREILKEKALFLSNKKLKSNTETGDCCQGENNPDKPIENSIENESKSTCSNELVKKKLLNAKHIKKDSLSHLIHNPKYLAKISQKSVGRLNKTSSHISGQNISPSVSNLSSDQKQLYPSNSKDDRNPLCYINSIVYFVMHEK